MTGTYRDSGEMGSMYFNRTLEDWAKFDVSNRTKHDASISTGLAIMANQKSTYLPEKKQSKIPVGIFHTVIFLFYIVQQFSYKTKMKAKTINDRDC